MMNNVLVFGKRKMYFVFYAIKQKQYHKSVYV